MAAESEATMRRWFTAVQQALAGRAADGREHVTRDPCPAMSPREVSPGVLDLRWGQVRCS
jgi:hypothetical protein